MRIQGVGLVHGVPKDGTVWQVPSARSAHARDARFFASFGNFFLIKLEFGTFYLLHTKQEDALFSG